MRRLLGGPVDADVSVVNEFLDTRAAQFGNTVAQEAIEALTVGVSGDREALRYQIGDSMCPLERRIMSTTARS